MDGWTSCVRPPPRQEGRHLCHEGEKFQFIYAVRSGTFKSSVTLKDGREQVTGFQMAGELMGLDGLAAGKHASSAIALEDAEICAIPYAHLSELAAPAASCSTSSPGS